MIRPTFSDTPAITRLQMSRNLSQGTQLEYGVRRALRSAGIRGGRVRSKLVGKPDILFGKAMLAIFLHGCFWHGCPSCKRNLTPKTNAEFWAEKRRKNQERDVRAEAELRAMGWEVLVFWECEIKKDMPAVVDKIREVRQRRLDEFAAAKEARRLAHEAKRAERLREQSEGK